MDTDKLISKFCQAVRNALDQSGLSRGSRLVVAVSGGPDSLALLHALCRIGPELGLSLHGAHLNHALRGQASDADAEFVSETFDRLGIPLAVDKADVAAAQRLHRLSLEEAARQVRLGFLARVMAEQDADAVAVGHTHDDQAETVLLHLIRGSGLTGIRGMQTKSTLNIDENMVTLVRPLLDVTREETEEFCRAIGVAPRLDESNLSSQMTRNRVRLELLPLMTSINPGVKDALVRLSRNVALDLALIERTVDQAAAIVVSQGDQAVKIDRQGFALLDPSVQHHLLRRAVLMAKPEVTDLTESHVQAMIRLISGPAGRSLDLPARLRFSVSYAEAIIGDRDRSRSPLPELHGETRLSVPGETSVGEWRVTVTTTTPSSSEPGVFSGLGQESRGCLTAHFDADALAGPLIVRPRRVGDKFQPLGMEGSKKLQDFMIDSRMQRESRDRAPLVVAERGIAWVAGKRIAEWARIREDTRRVLRIEFTMTDEPGPRPEQAGEVT
ncbi:MAG TPA: tRNA lysidine(34) synthetase TilS [Dehalococcoidia bacterium]|nr:tRNA lysidine(34) synthetase TilS [Dehalococcoidia bacterium]